MGALDPYLNLWTPIDMKCVVEPIGIHVVVAIGDRNLRFEALILLIFLAEPIQSSSDSRGRNGIARVDFRDLANLSSRVTGIAFNRYLSNPGMCAAIYD